VRTVHLKRGEDKRARAGHPWIFSNEIATSLKDFDPGDLVRTVAAGGYPLGVGYVNPRSLIAVRLLTAGRDDLEESFVRSRAAEALRLRECLYPGSDVYRAVYAESDGLPGLIVDRYGSAVAIQILTAGMERLRQEVQSAVLELLKPDVIVMRNDSRYRELEGLARERSVSHGTWNGPRRVDFAGLELVVDLLEGQKTGLYLDQRDNLEILAPFCREARVLDCFCYEGAWGLKAAACGAASVTAVDSSAKALEAARENASRNGCLSRWSAIEGDAFEVLEHLRGGDPFDVVILDPPSFARRKDRLAAAARRYREINMKAMALVARGGYLVSCSCSHHLDRSALRQVISEAAARAGRRAVVIEARGQSRDHPVLLSALETEYLKCFLMRVL
jgi:23S rRNA (cytosine1962-C5)-methyltransferase